MDDTTSTEWLHKDLEVKVLHVKSSSLGTRLECGYELLSYMHVGIGS